MAMSHHTTADITVVASTLVAPVLLSLLRSSTQEREKNGEFPNGSPVNSSSMIMTMASRWTNISNDDIHHGVGLGLSR